MKTPIPSAAAALAALFFSLAAFAQGNFPSRPVHIIVPFPAGGVADLLPRMIGEKLSVKWGQAVIVENKAGASGNIGMAEVARAAPDGYTLALAPAGNLTVNPLLFTNLPFDTHKAFAPVTDLAASPNVLAVNPAVPAKTFPELIAYAKAHPGKLNFASPGDGSGAHLAGELLKLDAGINMVHIPYKGLAPAVNDLLAGNVQMMFAGISTVLPHIKAGRLRPLAIASLERSPQLPDVPTVAESGYPGFEVTSWYGIVAPAGTPQALIDKIRHDMVEALHAPDVQARLSSLGLEPIGDTPQHFAATIQAETRKWDDIVKRAHIHVVQ